MDIVNHTGRIDYVIPYAVVRGMVTPPDEIEFTNTISESDVNGDASQARANELMSKL